MADAITADCHTDFKATRHSGIRPLADVIWIVMHDTEGGTAKSVAEYFASPSPGGSAHLVVDDNACYRCLTNEQVPWGAPSANWNGFHIEQCGYARWTSEQWLSHRKMLERGAYKTAYHCHLFGIPPIFRTAEGLKAKRPGITTHAEVSKAFPNAAGNHTDPGGGWPRALWMGLVRTHYEDLAGV
jgi:hypothetical protein